MRGIYVFSSTVRDIVGSSSPRTTGHLRIVLFKPGPLVEPPLPIEVEVIEHVVVGSSSGLVSISVRCYKTPHNKSPTDCGFKVWERCEDRNIA